MGPLQTFLDVLLFDQDHRRGTLSYVGLARVHLGLNSQLQTVESSPGVAVTQVGHGVHSLPLNKNCGPEKER